jgi:hypothetical protein
MMVMDSTREAQPGHGEVRWVVSLVFGGNGGNNAVMFWLGSLTWQEKIRLIPFVWVDFNLLDPTMLALS